MGYILKSARPLNLLMIIAAQIVTAYFLGFKNSFESIFDLLHISIYISTIFTAAGSYILNDLSDIKSDAVNKPSKNYLKDNLIKNLLKIAYLFLSFFALIWAFLSSVKLGIIVFILQILLILYNFFLKKIPIIGNILIAFITAFSIFIFNVFDPNIKVNLVIVFSIYAFGISFIREIIKDAQDAEGDSIAGRYTFPIMAGIRATRILLLVLIFIFVVVVTTCVRMMVEKYFTYPLNLVFITYNVLCIGIPLFHLSVKAQYASERNDFEYMSNVAKYIMITGILSMMFF